MDGEDCTSSHVGDGGSESQSTGLVVPLGEEIESDGRRVLSMKEIEDCTSSHVGYGKQGGGLDSQSTRSKSPPQGKQDGGLESRNTVVRTSN
eukprot:CAMPEP_0119051920 /NCGR_PEP_ID=MMETSP1177-20130426/73378_1 /TAXON_ID=2985 /ORGANISM="Ochromonas sp, Strain CCMP1899" /LENGTH=91 /DNA_ID=CAMNT_0007031291 /DNA_START=2275 /DNA_END=2550 /DNA_ORIENTATION=-